VKLEPPRSAGCPVPGSMSGDSKYGPGPPPSTDPFASWMTSPQRRRSRLCGRRQAANTLKVTAPTGLSGAAGAPPRASTRSPATSTKL